MWKWIMAKGDMAVSQAPMRLRQLTCAGGFIRDALGKWFVVLLLILTPPEGV